MAAGQGTTPRYVFDWKLFNVYVSKTRNGKKDLENVFETVRSPIGSGSWELTDKKDGVRFLFGRDQSSRISLTATVDPDTGEIKFTRGATGGLPDPWRSPSSQEAIIELMNEFVNDTLMERARDVRGFAETSKSFAFGKQGKTLPDEALSNIASMITGLKDTAGTPQEQMEILKKKANKGGRNKSKRASKKRRTTRRR